jgi:hypothetical protein
MLDFCEICWLRSFLVNAVGGIARLQGSRASSADICHQIAAIDGNLCIIRIARQVEDGRRGRWHERHGADPDTHAWGIGLYA